MFRAARWRSERNKIKAVFKMQFLATQISQPNLESLVVSLIPRESTKPTARSGKATVCDGSCQWQSPVYETIKFVQESKSGNTHNRIYRIIVSSTGTPKAAILGEASIDFADYVTTTQPFSVSLPLEAPDSSSLLHVTIQRLQDEGNERESGERIHNVVKTQKWMPKSPLNNRSKKKGYTTSGDSKDGRIITDNQSDNGEFLTKSSPAQVIGLHVESGHNVKESNSFDAMSISGSDTSSALYTLRDNASMNSGDILRDSISIMSPFSNSSTPRRPINRLLAGCVNQRTNIGWSVVSLPDGTTNTPTKGADRHKPSEAIEASEVFINKLKDEIALLARKVEASELELQSLRKQVVKEQKKRESLLRDLCMMKEERDELRTECEHLKVLSGAHADEEIPNGPQPNSADVRSLIEQISQELNHEKTVNATLRLQLQKTEKSNSELMLAVKNVNQMLEEKNSEKISNVDILDRQTGNATLPERNIGNELLHLHDHESSKKLCETLHEQNPEQPALQQLVIGHAAQLGLPLEKEFTDLNCELESSKNDTEELEMQLEQLALDYEILKQEKHEISLKLEQIQLREQLRMQYECSAHTFVINDLEARIEALQNEFENQAKTFEIDLASVTKAKIDQEKRAIQLQEELTKAKWKNVSIAECLQEELKRLSIQMTSIFNENEKLSMQVLAEASELRKENRHLEELIEKSNVELVSVQDHCRTRIEDLSREVVLSNIEIEQLTTEIQEQVQELENYKNTDAERIKAFSDEMMKVKTQLGLLVQEKAEIYELLRQKDDSQSKAFIREAEAVLQSESNKRLKSNVPHIGVDVLLNGLSKKSNELRPLKEHHESIVQTLNLEITTLKFDYSDLKVLFSENNLEKQNLKKQLSHLRDVLQRKEGKITTLESRLAANNLKVAALGSSENVSARKKDADCSMHHHKVNHLHEKIKPLGVELSVRNDGLHDTSITEKGMEDGRVEFKNGFERPGQSNPRLNHKQKEVGFIDAQCNGIHIGGKKAEALIDYKEKSCTCYSNGMGSRPFLRKESGAKIDASLNRYPCDTGKMTKMLNEMTLLRQRNEFMRVELKEMREKYCEMSLKIAEVEGKRQ